MYSAPQPDRGPPGVSEQWPPWEPLLLPLPQSLFLMIELIEHDFLGYGINILAHLGHLSQLCFFPVSFPPSARLVDGSEWETERSPWCLVSTVQSKHQCAINTVLITHPKHSTPRAAVKTVNSIWARLSQESCRNSDGGVCLCTQQWDGGHIQDLRMTKIQSPYFPN